VGATSKPWQLEATDFAAIKGWQTDDHVSALAAFRLSAAHHLETPYKQRQITFDGTVFNVACQASLEPDINAKAFFEFWFEPHVIVPDGQRGNFTGKVTGYYEPIIETRLNKGDGFETPFLRRPDDLIELNDAEVERLNGMRFGRMTDSKITPYFNRPDIDGGALAGRNLEIAYVRDPVDAFFAHVQGCGRLQLPNGETSGEKSGEIRITYDGKSGHEFTGIGRILIDSGEIPVAQISMQSIRDWLKAHPLRVSEILHHNKSYIFFREEPVADFTLGPIAAAKVPVSAGRSIAIDRNIHAFGLPFFVSASELKSLEPDGFSRLMIAQDTGSAILGAARADLFIGSGDAAGAIAGSINYEAQFHILLPRKGLT
jgi:membrane-bound lytic murein transglycosylase A